MSINCDDIHKRYHNFYIRNETEKNKWINGDWKARWKEYTISAKEAVIKEGQRQTGYQYDNEDDDLNNYHGRWYGLPYWKCCELWEFCGDTKEHRFWWDVSDFEIDKTENVHFRKIIRFEDIDENYYNKTPDDYNQVRKLLTPWAAQRQYGKVFFSTETRYIDKDKRLSPARKLNVEGYYKENGVKLFVPFVRQPRSNLFHPPKTGTTTYNSKKFVYHHTGTGILKTRNFEGQRYHYFVQRIRTIEQDIEDPIGRTTQTSVGGNLFEELRNCHFDLDVWGKTFQEVTTASEKTIQDRGYFLAQETRENSKKYARKIKTLVLKKIKHANLIRRVQRKWRTGSRRFSTLGVFSYKIQRGWRAYLLRGVGTRRTAIGLIGRNTQN